MSMRLTADDFISISAVLHKLNDDNLNMSVQQFRCVGHIVIVEREDPKQNKGPYVVKGITNGIVRDSSRANR